MVDKLRLPFPMLSDPGGERVIKPYDLWNPDREVAKPAVVIVDPAGEEAHRWVSRDFADRVPEDDLLEQAGSLGLPATEQPAPTPGEPDPGPRAYRIDVLPTYFRGAKFAATAMGMRYPEAKDDADAYVEEMERYTAAIKAIRDDAER